MQIHQRETLSHQRAIIHEVCLTSAQFIKKWREGKSQQKLSKISAKSQQNPSKILAKSQQNFEVHCVQEGFALAIYQEVERREIETLLAL